MLRSIHLFLAFALCISLCSNAQEKESYRKLSAKFEQHYNAGNYDSIYALFSPEMKSALPQDQTREFFKGLSSDAGQIKERAYLANQGGYAQYKTKFDRGAYSLFFSVDNRQLINGFYVKPFTETKAAELKRNTTPMQLPFRDEWTVFWGGDTKEQNYHVETPAQKGAFDLVITDKEGKSFKNNGQKNEDYYAFGKDLLSPCDGYVVLSVDGVKDNKPGEVNPFFIPGNTVVIKTKANEYIYLAHFKQGSVRVKQGQPVRKGQVLGQCGNSGHSSEPHLHFHIQNTESMVDGTGAKCYFDKLQVNGKAVQDYSPVKGDKIRMAAAQ